MASRSRKGAILAAAATYIGTVVGAGFASGQEVLQFFGLNGPTGFLAIIMASGGFAYFGFLIMDLGRRLRASSHEPIFRDVAGRFASALDIVTTFFLFGALSAMVAGAGSVLEQEFGLPWLAGATLMAVASVVTVFAGLRGVVAAVSTVVPFLIGGVLFVSLGALARDGLKLSSPPPGFSPAVSPWPLAGLTYISYNIVMSVPVLAALGRTLKSKEEAQDAALLGASGLGLSLTLVYLALVSSLPDVLGYQIPMAYLASEVVKFAGLLYTSIFLAEVYTTAVADLYGIAARLFAPGTLSFAAAATLTGLASVWAASAGFSNIVRTVYPAVGWAGLTFLIALLMRHLRRKRPPDPPSISRRKRWAH